MKHPQSTPQILQNTYVNRTKEFLRIATLYTHTRGKRIIQGAKGQYKGQKGKKGHDRQETRCLFSFCFKEKLT